jgi:hypothetical protein
LYPSNLSCYFIFPTSFILSYSSPIFSVFSWPSSKSFQSYSSPLLSPSSYFSSLWLLLPILSSPLLLLLIFFLSLPPRSKPENHLGRWESEIYGNTDTWKGANP